MAPGEYHPDLAQVGACFVTLNRKGKLRGCMGSPQASQVLVVDVAENAYSAAFKDTRFPNLTEDELAGLQLSLSVLSPSWPLVFTDEVDLTAQLRPGVDGLIIEDKGLRALSCRRCGPGCPSRRRFSST